MRNDVGDPGLDKRRAAIDCAESEDNQDVLDHAVRNRCDSDEEGAAEAREATDERPLGLILISEPAGADNVAERRGVRWDGVMLSDLSLIHI